MESCPIPVLIVGTKADLAPQRAKLSTSGDRLNVDCRREIPAGSTASMTLARFARLPVDIIMNVQVFRGSHRSCEDASRNGPPKTGHRLTLLFPFFVLSSCGVLLHFLVSHITWRVPKSSMNKVSLGFTNEPRRSFIEKKCQTLDKVVFLLILPVQSLS